MPLRDDYPFTYIHRDHICGGIAFFSKRKFQTGDILLASDMVFENGEYPTVNDEVKCGHCGRIFSICELNENTFEVNL